MDRATREGVGRRLDRRPRHCAGRRLGDVLLSLDSAVDEKCFAPTSDRCLRLLSAVDIEPIDGLPGTRGANDPQVGEVWAWRSGTGSMIGVTVLQWGVRRTPPRHAYVKVQFPDERLPSEGWLTPSRLVSRWEDLGAYLMMQAKWDAVTADNPPKDSSEEAAARTVFDELIPARVAEMEGSSRGPILYVYESVRLAQLSGLDEAVWTQYRGGFQLAGGPNVAPWPATLRVAQEVAKRDPQPLLQIVDAEEERVQLEAANGRWTDWARGQTPRMWMSPRDAEEEDLRVPYGKPMRDILRTWCGTEPCGALGGLHAAARSNLVAVHEAAWQAVAAMSSAGLGGPAERLASALTGLQTPTELDRSMDRPKPAALIPISQQREFSGGGHERRT